MRQFQAGISKSHAKFSVIAEGERDGSSSSGSNGNALNADSAFFNQLDNERSQLDDECTSLTDEQQDPDLTLNLLRYKNDLDIRCGSAKLNERRSFYFNSLDEGSAPMDQPLRTSPPLC